jgi:hypothetical protein
MSSKLWLPTWGLEQASVSHAAAVQSDPGRGLLSPGARTFFEFSASAESRWRELSTKRLRPAMESGGEDGRGPPERLSG